jgi:hypothetical protein
MNQRINESNNQSQVTDQASECTPAQATQRNREGARATHVADGRPSALVEHANLIQKTVRNEKK